MSFTSRGWVEGSPENPWPEAFASWDGQIRDDVGDRLHDALVCDFSTTGPVERAASQIVMMDVFERYFAYIAYGICGIPAVTLEGTPADWDHLCAKVAALDVFDLDWWLVHLRPICDEFARASRGAVDLEHWRGICKLRSEYGGHVINGWVARLFPYLLDYIDGPCNRRNPIFETGEGFQAFVAPTGLSRVPFLWRNVETGRERFMEAIGGLVGVTQAPDSLALRPAVGWAVREVPRLEALLGRLRRDHATSPGRMVEEHTDLPPDLAQFFSATDGAEVRHADPAFSCRIVPRDQIEPLDWGETSDDPCPLRPPNDRTWCRLAWLADGRWLAINLDPYRRDPNPDEDANRSFDREFSPICLGGPGTQGQPGRNPVVALSFTELLGRLVEAGETPFWLDPESIGYGDAERYTRRK